MFGVFDSDFIHPTPLLRSIRIGPSVGLDNLYFKLETGHRTGSYKDRFAAAAVAEMKKKGQHTCIATSSGNTGAALAAYCAAADIRCCIAVVETAPPQKLIQMHAYGAEISRVRGFGLEPIVTEATFDRLKSSAGQSGCALQISAFCYSPIGMNGVETISREIASQLPEAAHVFSPAGGGGLTLAIARGFGQTNTSPAVHVVQPDGNDTMAGPLRAGASQGREVDCLTNISGLQVPSVLDGNEVISSCRKSGGAGHLVSDDAIWATQRRLAREEGVFVEPAGAVALTGAMKAAAQGEIEKDAPVDCIMSGSGFKDFHSIEQMTADSSCPLIECEEIEW